MLMETGYYSDTFRPEIESTVNTGYRREAAWLNRAIPLDIYLEAPRELMNDITNELFNEVIERLGPKRNHNRLRSALKSIIINIYTAYTINAPLRYSRSKDDYAEGRRYGKLYFKHSRIIPLFDALIALSYIHQKRGYQINGEGHQTRAWATSKLIQLFHKFGMEKIDIRKEPKEELVVLNITKGEGKKAKKVKVPYKDTEQTRSCRSNLEEYNKFISSHRIKLDIPGEAHASYDNIHKLYRHSAISIIVPLYIDYRTYNQPDNEDYNIGLTHTYTITRSIRDTASHINGINADIYHSTAVKKSDSQYRCDVEASRMSLNLFHQKIGEIITEAGGWKEAIKTEVMTKKHKLSDLGIHRMVFGIRYNYLHRVFNNGSFDDGGRFYGAFHIGTNKDWRKRYILINGSPTVELDYSAHHIRILYHLEGIDYDDDPYDILCKKPEERKIYKKILLTAINADSEIATIKSFIREARNDQEISCPLTHGYVGGLIANFKNVHKPIAKHICSGIGVRLMNIDSRITEAILMRMTRGNIPCLPVHDSYIVPVEHKDILNLVMIEEYKKIMGGLPIIKQS